MTRRIAELSPLFKARTAGLCWLMTILTSTFAVFVGGRLIVSGDAATTATNILGHQALFRSGIAANLIASIVEERLGTVATIDSLLSSLEDAKRAEYRYWYGPIAIETIARLP